MPQLAALPQNMEWAARMDWAQILVPASYMVGGSIGWWIMDRYLEKRRKRREAREAQMRDVTPK